MKVTYYLDNIHSFGGINLPDHIVDERYEGDESNILLLHMGSICLGG